MQSNIATAEIGRIDPALAEQPARLEDLVAVKPLQPFCGTFLVADASAADLMHETVKDMPDGSLKKLREYRRKVDGRVSYQRQMTSREVAAMDAGNLHPLIEPIQPMLAGDHFHGTSMSATKPTMCIQHQRPEHARIDVPWHLSRSLVARGLAEYADPEAANKADRLEREHAKAKS